MRGLSSDLATFLSGKNQRAKAGYPGGQMAVAGTVFIFDFVVYPLQNCFSRSQSRMRGDFLWYEEQIEMSQEERDAKAARRCASRSSSRFDSLIRNSQGEEGSGPCNPFRCPTARPSGQNRGIHQANVQHPRSSHIWVPQVAHCCILLRT